MLQLLKRGACRNLAGSRRATTALGPTMKSRRLVTTKLTGPGRSMLGGPLCGYAFEDTFPCFRRN